MRKIWLYLMLGMVGLLVVGAWGAAGLPDGKLHLWFLDVGQGDAILARLPAGEWVLIDGGPDSSVVQRLSGLMPFYEREIDVVILSHPHADHLNGLVEVFKRYRVKNLLYTFFISK
jgi:competence protein ComEC